eukprot:3284713-Alexandrium_andersonii.AAC.1
MSASLVGSEMCIRDSLEHVLVLEAVDRDLDLRDLLHELEVVCGAPGLRDRDEGDGRSLEAPCRQLEPAGRVGE